MRCVDCFVSLRHEAHGLPCEVHEFYAARPAAARLLIAPVRSDYPLAARASLIAARVPLLQLVLPLLQPVLPLLQPVLRSCNVCTASCNLCLLYCSACCDVTRAAMKYRRPATTQRTVTSKQRRSAKALSLTSTLLFARLLTTPGLFHSIFPFNLPVALPRATVQVASVPFRRAAIQSARISQAPL